MAEISTQNDEPRPAKPILASYLLELEEQRRKKFTSHGRPQRLSSGCGEVDALLGGDGIERGIVAGISSDGDDGRLMSLNFLASVLVSHLSTPYSSTPTTKASVIDSTGTFPLSTLASILRERIKKAKSAGEPPRLNPSIEEIKAETVAVDRDVTRCLEMVGISRVFDVEGLWEVLSEISRSSDPSIDGGPVRREDSEETQSQHEVEIADSEDDEEATPPLPDNQKKNIDEGVEIIIIDNITQIINELFSRKEKSDAHGLLTLLCKTLTVHSQITNTLTVLHNTLIPITTPKTYTNPSTTTNPNPYNFTNPHEINNSSSRSIIRNPSLFPSNTVKPALGQIFTQFLGLHLFLSKLPLTTRDAEISYGFSNPTQTLPSHSHSAAVKYATVLEILSDISPTSRRSSTWLPLLPTPTCYIPAFQRTGNRKGLAMERVKKVLGEKTGEDDEGLGKEGEEGVAGAERLTGRGVSNVAKIYGFGGRRV